MASTSSSGRAKCKRNVAGKVCRCQEWEPSEDDESLCDCCKHHMSFHELCHPIESGYGRCMEEFEDAGSSHEDGCQEYFSPCAPKSRKCAGCGCHRSFHEKVTGPAGEQLAGPSNVRSQREDSLIQPWSKKITLDPEIISIQVEGDEQAGGSGDNLIYESNVPNILGASADAGLELESSVEDGNTSLRSSDEVNACPLLQSKHTIFLSHSGAQKDFVEGLCEDLERRLRFPFFDKRPSSLSKGVRFPDLILEAAQQCKMAVVVVSEEYLTSKWPMIELNTFVKALSGSNSSLKILPLFFGLSVSEFGDLSRQANWFKEWNKWAEDDVRIKPSEFKSALKVMRSFNGMEFNQVIREVSAYRRDVVATICKTILPDIKWDNSHVQGYSNLCKAFREKIEGVQPSREYNIRVIGFYGMGGIGKTTMCKTLCNELLEFEEKVCHIELAANQTSEKLLKEVLKKLTSATEEVLHDLNEGECVNILNKSASWKQKTFLAIDNVWDNSKSLEQAKMFLESAAFHEGSVVMVTARSLRTLGYLGIDDSQCFEVPELSEEDARNLLLYHAAKGRKFVGEDDNRIIKECVARCWFQKSEKQGFHYLPLALKVLGLHLGCFGNKPADWLKNLPKVRDFNHFPEENPVFGVLRVNFDRLTLQEQALFMDIGLFNPLREYGDTRWRSIYKVEHDLVEWLRLVHRQKLEDIENQLQRLKEKGLLEDVDLKSQEFSMHDLYREFAVMEAQGKLNFTSFNSRRWALYWRGTYPTDLEMTPSGGCWESLIRVGIEQKEGTGDAIWSLQGIEWKYCSNVVVLELIGLDKLKGVLDLSSLRCLRSLELEQLDKLDGLEGLEALNNLTYFLWFGGYRTYDDIVQWTLLGQLPASLNVLQVSGVGVHLSREVFSRCTNLYKLKLELIRVGDGLDFSQCTSLRSVMLCQIRGLQNLEPATGLTSCLQRLRIDRCDNLSDVSGLDGLVGLQHLELTENVFKNLPDLQKLTSLQVLRITFSGIPGVPGLGSLRQLRELCCSVLDLTELPNLSGLEQLHRLDLSWCTNLTTLEGVGDLPALRHLDLQGCFRMLRLLDLSSSTNLEELDISRSAIKLQEGDIHMLAKLPMLRLVKITHDNTHDNKGFIKLDPMKRKVVKCRFDGTEGGERDLETPPINVSGYKF